jgi:hypothetical protein
MIINCRIYDRDEGIWQGLLRGWRGRRRSLGNGSCFAGFSSAISLFSYQFIGKFCYLELMIN